MKPRNLIAKTGKMNILNHISIRNFKSVRHLDLELRPLNLFIGANGAGKSNLISVFRFLNQMSEGNLQNHTASLGGADSILYFGRKTSDEMTFTLSFEDGMNEYECGLSPGPEDNFFFNRERIRFYDEKQSPSPQEELWESGHAESKLSAKGGTSANHAGRYAVRDLQTWKPCHFHDTGENAKVRQTCDLEDNLTLRPDARNLAAFLYRLERKFPGHFGNIQEAVRMAAPFFERFSLQPSRLNEEKIRLEWKEKGSDDYFNAAALSDGTLRFVCLATLLFQPSLPRLILLDEPELGLHPYAVSLLADLLRSTARHTQVIAATQSVTLVNQFEPEDIVVVDRNECGESLFRRLDRSEMEDWLDEYGMGDLWEKNIFGGRP